MLGKKYFKFWKRKAWSLGLLRKARERRKTFASWIGELSEGPQNRSSGHDALGSASGHRTLEATSALRTPSQPLDRRKNLLGEALREAKFKVGSSAEKPLASRSSNAEQNPTRHSNVHHMRPRTVKNMPPSQFSSSSVNSDVYRIAQNHERGSVAGKMDTTCTDYFRLKALGLDPDTPPVPSTSKKRPREQDFSKSEKRLKPTFIRLQENLPIDWPGEQSSYLRKTPVLQPNRPSLQDEDDSDESLFARSRKVRETMSESISWLRSERARSESRSKIVVRAVADGTPVPKKFEHPWPTLSRTEQRLRTTGAHGLLPKAWEGNPSWRDMNGHISTHSPSMENKQQPSSPEVSTTMTPIKRKVAVPWTVEPMNVQGMSESNEVGWGVKGSSVEDAIEL